MHHDRVGIPTQFVSDNLASGEARCAMRLSAKFAFRWPTCTGALVGDVQVSLENGTVAFSSGLHGWRFFFSGEQRFCVEEMA